MNTLIKEKFENILIKAKKNFKFLLFMLIFFLTCLMYNTNSQTLNFVLKRGIILEYQINQTQFVNKKNIENYLESLKIKYASVVEETNDNSSMLSIDNEKKLFITLPYLAKENKTSLINNVSDYIFDNYNNATLKDIKTLNDNYNTPFGAFLKFINLCITAILLWLILMLLIFDKKTLIQTSKDNFSSFLKKKKDDFLNFLKNSKEKGFKYFLKKLLFDDTDDKKDDNITKEIINTIVFVIICVIVIRYFVGELRWIPSGSMRPTIMEKDRVFVEKLDFPKKDIKRGDILVFYPPEVQLSNSPFAVFSRLSGIFCKDIAFIKRVIGMPNDKFEVKYDQNQDEYYVYINDKKLDEPYIISRHDWTPCNEDMFCGPFTIPEDNYFMMGDNRGNSQDSRFWGFLDKNRIIGRANFMFFPISRINVLKDKYLNLHSQKVNNSFENKDFIINRYELLYKI